MSATRIQNTFGGGGGADSDIVKIAVTYPTTTDKPQNYLIHFSKSEGLNELVKELYQFWALDGGVESYGLKFDKNGEYLTEASVKDLKNGVILKLGPSVNRFANDVVNRIKSTDDIVCFCGAEEILSGSSDVSMVEQFIKFGGFQAMMEILTESRKLCSPQYQMNCESKLLGALVEIMKHDDIPFTWDDEVFEGPFIARISANICGISTNEKNSSEMIILKHSLVVLESLCSSSKRNQVQESIPARSLLSLVTLTSETEVQISALSLYNTLFAVASRERKSNMRRTFEEMNTRDFILTKILPAAPSTEMKRQIFLTQCNLFDDAAYLMNLPVEDQRIVDKIKELRRLAFSPDVPKSNAPRGRLSEDYKSLGFISIQDPANDFRSTPPGILPLDLMVSFAQNQTDLYSKMTIENSYRMGDNNHSCPFVASSISLTKLICAAIHIGEPNMDKIETDVQPMLFSNANGLETLFSITIQHLFKTWREMRATSEDFDKVIEVSREQLTKGLKNVPQTFEEFQKGLMTYSQVSDCWKEAAKTKNEHESKAVEELRQILKPDMVNLVQRQRLGFIVTGTKFTKLRREGGSRHLYLKLNPNHKTLYYGDWNENDGTPTIESLSNKTAVVDIKALLTGQECLNHISGAKDNRRYRGGDTSSHLYMSILTDNSSIDIIAPDQKTFDCWCDAINALLRKDMSSTKAVEDIELFLAMEIKIKLLDVEGIELPKHAPPIPPPPPPIDSGRNRQ